MSGNASVIEMPALGRPFQLGMLYDATTDKLIQGHELWEREALQTAQQDKPYIDTQFSVIVDDSLATKSQHLDATGNAKMSLLAGLVEVSGASKFYNDRKSTRQVIRVSVHFKFLSRKCEVDIQQLGLIKDPSIISATRATHVVSGILFGLEAFLIIDRPYSVEEETHVSSIQDKVNTCAHLLASMYNSGKSDFRAEIDQDEATKYYFQLCCDLSLPSPSSLKDITFVLKNQFLNFFKEGASCSNVVPKKVWLHPLSEIDSSAPIAHTFTSSDGLVCQAENVLADLNDAEVWLNDIGRNNVQACSTIQSFREQQTQLLTLLKRFRSDLMRQLSNMISKIRNGSIDSDQLGSFLREIANSPFGCSQLGLLLKNTEQEIRAVSQYIQSLGSVKYVPCDEIDGFSIDFDCIVSFEFRLSKAYTASLGEMDEYLQRKSPAQSDISTKSTNSWYKDGTKKRKIQIKAKLFKEFAQINSEKRYTAFVITVSSDISSTCDEGARVILYAEDEAIEFDLPSKPLHPQIKKDCGNEICLTWSKPKSGYQNILSYVVTYFSAGETESTAQTKEISESIVVKDLYPQQEYQFEVQAECIAGLSPKSDVLVRKAKPIKKPAFTNSEAKGKKQIFFTKRPRTSTPTQSTKRSRTKEQQPIELSFPPSFLFGPGANIPTWQNPTKRVTQSQATPIVLPYPSLVDRVYTRTQLLESTQLQATRDQLRPPRTYATVAQTSTPHHTHSSSLEPAKNVRNPEHQPVLPLSTEHPQTVKEEPIPPLLTKPFQAMKKEASQTNAGSSPSNESSQTHQHNQTILPLLTEHPQAVKEEPIPPLLTKPFQATKKEASQTKAGSSQSNESGQTHQYNIREEGASEFDTDSRAVPSSAKSSAKLIATKESTDKTPIMESEQQQLSPSKMGKPKPKNVTYKSIELEWNKPSFGRKKIQYYSVIYYASDSSDGILREKKTEGAEQSITIKGLNCETGYIFKVQATFPYGIKLESEPTGAIHTKAHLAETIRKKSNLTSKKTTKKPAIYELVKTPIMVNKMKKMAKYEVGEPLDGGTIRVLMVVGATGAGKTTLINGIANYMYGVQWEDDFRFNLVAHEPAKKSQAQSHTSWITAYTLHRGASSPIPYSLTIIDTPGFGDTEGIDRDKKIADQIKDFFSVNPPEGIDVLHGIGFVAQASLARLSHSQQYIFDSILSIYGRDVASNIFLMTTFADGQDPPVMEAIIDAKIPHQKYFKFNNSALFVNGKKGTFDAMFWEMGMMSFQGFFNDFGKAEHRSLQLTREVLEEREQLENVLKQLQPQIHTGLTKMDELQRVVVMLERNKSLIEQNKDFVFRVQVTKQRKINTTPGLYTTNCLNCNFTCHDNCIYANDSDKKSCCAMNPDGDCGICPGKCIWSKHVNNPYIFELYTEEEVRTSGELKDRYDTAVEGESRAETMIGNIKHDVTTLEFIVLDLVNAARKRLMRLDEIALKPNPLSEVDYVDLLIKSEEQQGKRGWSDRVSSYKILRKRASLMRKIKDHKQDDVEESLFSWLGEDGASSSYTPQTMGYLRSPAEKKRWYQFWKSE